MYSFRTFRADSLVRGSVSVDVAVCPWLAVIGVFHTMVLTTVTIINVAINVTGWVFGI